jgi:tRNA nucleotidyltransferase/poly(A) polymerase
MDFKEKINQSLLEVFGRDQKSINSKLVEIAKQNGGKAYIVGGAVRDEIMGKESKDIDYLITKTPINDLASKLTQAFPSAKIDEVGKSFGIIKMNIDGEEYDIAIPRADTDRSTVNTDPNIPVEDDLLRRDTVINAMAKDLETGEIISPPGYDGVSDIKNKIMRAVGNPVDRFSEDPLRMLRVISQSSRFGFEIEEKTLEAIKMNVDLLKKVSSERFYDEFYKGWTKGNKDTGKFFKLLDDSGIGRLMFGDKFAPIALKPDDDNFFLKQYIAAFLQGGDYKAMNKKVDEQRFVETARLFYDMFNSKRDITDKEIRVLSSNSNTFDLINKTFYSISENLGEWMQNFLSKPLIPKKEVAGEAKPYELPLTGGELIELANSVGVELKGKAIGDAVNNLILAYRSGKIDQSANQSKEETLNVIKNWLSNTVIKENWFKENKQIDIIKHRLNNILYK